AGPPWRPSPSPACAASSLPAPGRCPTPSRARGRPWPAPALRTRARTFAQAGDRLDRRLGHVAELAAANADQRRGDLPGARMLLVRDDRGAPLTGLRGGADRAGVIGGLPRAAPSTRTTPHPPSLNHIGSPISRSRSVLGSTSSPQRHRVKRDCEEGRSG